MTSWNLLDMGATDPIAQFGYVVQQIADKHPNFAFIHVVEPRVQGVTDVEVPEGQVRAIQFRRWHSPTHSGGVFLVQRFHS